MKRFKYNFRHNWIADIRPGYLTPVLCEEVLPGDIFNGSINAMIRLAPLELPAFAQMDINLRLFFVEHSLTFPEFPGVITGEDTTTPWPVISHNYNDTLVSPLPVSTALGVGSSSIPYNINALPIYAYNQIYNDHYRDTSVHTSPGTLSANSLRPVFHSNSDYFASSVSAIQQGSKVEIDVSGGTLDMQTFRNAQHKQHWQERRARYGNTYNDYLRLLGVQGSHDELNRAKYIGRARTVMNISEIVAMATSAGENTGEYKGHGVAALRMRVKPRMFREHGTLMAMVTMTPRNQLLHRIDRHHCKIAATLGWSKDEIYSPEYVNDQMEPLFAAEVSSKATTYTNIIGYLPKYEWLRKPRDVIAGAMTLPAQRAWTTAKDMGTVPSLINLHYAVEPVDIFQDTTLTTPRAFYYGDNRLVKRTIVKPSAR